MGRITFFSTPQPRSFNYKPRYYDEDKERLAKIYEKYGKNPDGTPNPEAQKKSTYVPGANIRGSFRKSIEESRDYSKGGTMKSIFTVTTILFIIVIVFCIGKVLLKFM
jgi:hypothetical protein